MKRIILISIMTISLNWSKAATYYVDSRVATAGNGLSAASPFKSYSSVPLVSGDIVLFACGSAYSQSITISLSGVTFGSYGTGAKPLFSNSANWYVFMVSGSGITIDGLQIGVSTYSGVELTGGGNTILNCLFTGMPKGIAVSGANNHIHHNIFRDGIMQPGRTGADDDVGALGICLNTGANVTEIAYNSFINCKTPSPDYGEDGGALEVYGNVNGIKFHHNYAENCCGVFEMGGGAVQNVEIYRNLLKNNYGMGGIHTSGSFAATISNINIVHNTVYDVSGSSEVFWVFGSSGQSEVKFRNNIVFYSGFQRFSSASGIVHQNNIFFSPVSNPLGIPADASEVSGTNPNFVSATDYHLTSGSIAINKGQITPYNTDYDGLPMVGNPDAGTYEFQTIVNPDLTPPSNPAGLNATSITAISFTLNWNASTDNVGVTGYDVFRNGILVTSTNSTTASISGLTASTGYSMTVRAKDAAGNVSPVSTALNVTTASLPNLLLNPGFENGITNWSGSGSKIANSSVKYAGNFGLLISSRVANWSGPQQVITNPLISNGSGAYYAEAFVRMASGSAMVRITVKYTIGGLAYFASTPAVSVGKSNFIKISGTLIINLTGPVQSAVYYIETTSGRTNFYADQCLLNKLPSSLSPLRLATESEVKKIEEETHVFPNPVNGEFMNIDLGTRLESEKVNIKLHDITGKVVMDVQSENERAVKLPTEGLKSGLYFLTIKGSNDNIINRKIIIQQ